MQHEIGIDILFIEVQRGRGCELLPFTHTPFHSSHVPVSLSLIRALFWTPRGSSSATSGSALIFLSLFREANTICHERSFPLGFRFVSAGTIRQTYVNISVLLSSIAL